MQDYLTNQKNEGQVLPNATATLVLGIISIVVCFVCGIVALIISNRDVAMYKSNPEQYSLASYNNIKAGRICAIIGIILQVLGMIVYGVFMYYIFNSLGKGQYPRY